MANTRKKDNDSLREHWQNAARRIVENAGQPAGKKRNVISGGTASENRKKSSGQTLSGGKTIGKDDGLEHGLNVAARIARSRGYDTGSATGWADMAQDSRNRATSANAIAGTPKSAEDEKPTSNSFTGEFVPTADVADKRGLNAFIASVDRVSQAREQLKKNQQKIQAISEDQLSQEDKDRFSQAVKQAQSGQKIQSGMVVKEAAEEKPKTGAQVYLQALGKSELGKTITDPILRNPASNLVGFAAWGLGRITPWAVRERTEKQRKEKEESEASTAFGPEAPWNEVDEESQAEAEALRREIVQISGELNGNADSGGRTLAQILAENPYATKDEIDAELEKNNQAGQPDGGESRREELEARLEKAEAALAGINPENTRTARQLNGGDGLNAYVSGLRVNLGLSGSILEVRRQLASAQESQDEAGQSRARMLESQLGLLESEQDIRNAIEDSALEREFGLYPEGSTAQQIAEEDMAKFTALYGDSMPLADYEEALDSGAWHGMLYTDTGARRDMTFREENGERLGMLIGGAAGGYKTAVSSALKTGQEIEYQMNRLYDQYLEETGQENEGKHKMSLEEMMRSGTKAGRALTDWQALIDPFENFDPYGGQRERLAEKYPVAYSASQILSEVTKMKTQAVMGGAAKEAFTGAYGGASYAAARIAGKGVPEVADVADLGTFQIKYFEGLEKGAKLAETMHLGGMPFMADAFVNGVRDAREAGANEDQVFAAGVLNAIVVGPMEQWAEGKLAGVGARLAGTQAGQAAVREGSKWLSKHDHAYAVLSLLKTGLTEGLEEALEEPAQNLIAKGIYAPEMPLTGEGGVFDAEQMWESGKMGALVGVAYPLIGAAGGMLGRDNQRQAQEIIQKAEEGEEVSQGEMEDLATRAMEEALIQEETARIEGERAGEIEQAQKAAEQAERQEIQAREAAQQAQEKAKAAAREAQPIINSLNEGTANYSDPQVQRRIGEANKAMRTAQEQAAELEKSAAMAAREAETARKAAEDREKAVREEAAREARARIKFGETDMQRFMAANETEETGAEEDAEGERIETEAAPQDRAGAIAASLRAYKKRVGQEAAPGVQNLNNVRLDGDGEAQIRILDSLARHYGLEVDLVATLGGKNGMYAGERRIVVAADALEGAYLQVGAHELTHYVKRMGGDSYTILESTVLDYLGQNDVFDLEEAIAARMAEYAQAGQELTREAAIEEIVAEAVPTVFGDAEALRMLVDRNRTLAEKVRDFFVSFARRLRQIALNYAAESDHMEIAALTDNAEALMDIAYALDDALEASRTGTAEEGGDKYSVNPLARFENPNDKRDEAIQQVAAQVVREFRTDAERSQVVDLLAQAEKAYEEGRGEDAEKAAGQAARLIVERSRRTDTSQREGYEETRKRLRTQGITLTETQKQEVANHWGSYNDYRKAMMGNVKIVNDGMSLDGLWGELSGEHPEYFPAETNEAEMPLKIAEFVQAMRPRYLGEAGASVEEIAAELSMRLQGEMAALAGDNERGDRARQDAAMLREERQQRQADREEEARARAIEERIGLNRGYAERIRAAKQAGDDAAIQEVLNEYRAERRGATRGQTIMADAVEMGMNARQLRGEARRLERMISQINAEITPKGSEDILTDRDLRHLYAERDSYQEILNQLRRQITTLQRQEAITAAGGSDISLDGEAWLTDADIETALHELEAEDESEARDSLIPEMRDRVQRFKESAAQRFGRKGYNTIMVASLQDVETAFEGIEEEIQMQAQSARVWKQRAMNADSQLEAEKRELRRIQRERAAANARGENTQALAELEIESRDRVDILTSQKKMAEANAKYNRRIGAESLSQALREGRLPEPVMDRIVALFKDARKARPNDVLHQRRAEIRDALQTGRFSGMFPARVWDEVFGDAAPLVKAIYYDQVQENEAKKQAWIAGWREKIGALKLTRGESYLVQKIGEGKATQQEMEEASQKVYDGIKVFRAFYDEAYDLADPALRRNGYSMGRRSNYFPHMEVVNAWWKKMGFGFKNAELPTAISGTTDSRRPGRQWSQHMQRRKGDATDYDALYGFEEYIGTVANVIYHTDDIQRHRQLASAIRAAAETDKTWPDRDVHGEAYYGNHFVKWLDEYTNGLAGKKSAIDRAAENVYMGRVVYSVLNELKKIKGASAVAGNLSSAVTNMIPVAEMMGEHPVAAIKGLGMMMSQMMGRDGAPESQYKMRRYGSDSVNQTFYEKFMKAAGKPFDLVDALATNWIVNAYYQNNLDMGMDPETAMRNADRKAALVQGDRSYGASPTAYNSKLLGFFTQFQLEVANQSQHFRKDLPREYDPLRLLAVLFGTSVVCHLWNEINYRLTGRRPAPDPFEMAKRMYQRYERGEGFLQTMRAGWDVASEAIPYANIGGRVAAFDSIGELVDAIFEDGAGWDDLGYAGVNALVGLVPIGNQIRKTWKGGNALYRGGYYNRAGTKVNYPVDKGDMWTTAQALLFGPSATEGARAYYSGEAKALTPKQTGSFERLLEQGYGANEAFANETDYAASDKLETEAKAIDKALGEAESRRLAGLEPQEADAEQAEANREEAARIRTEGSVTPTDLLPGAWLGREDTPAVRNAVAMWRATNNKDLLPIEYTADTGWTKNHVDFLGEDLAREANEMFEKGYEEIMAGLNVEEMSAEEMAEIGARVKALEEEIKKTMKAKMNDRRGDGK